MVVGPASTLDSWKNEVAKWAPSMDAIVYRPQEEDRAETLRPFLPDRRQTGKILITSYEMVIRDMKYLKRCAWKFGIIDQGPPTLIINEGAPTPHPHPALTPPSRRLSSPHTMCRNRGPPRPPTLDKLTPLDRGLLRPSAQEHELQARQGAQGHLRRQTRAAVHPAAPHRHAVAERPNRALVAAQPFQPKLFRQGPLQSVAGDQGRDGAGRGEQAAPGLC